MWLIIQKVVEESKKILGKIRSRLKRPQNIRKRLRISRWHALSLIAICVSIIGSSPITSRFIIYYTYEPKYMIGFPSVFDGNSTIDFSILPEENRIINIVNNDAERYVRIEIEFTASAPIKTNSEFGGYFIEKGLGGGGFRFVTETFYLPPYSSIALSYPFLPYSEEFNLKLIIYSKMQMSEFGLPYFFGDIDLRPIEKTFTIQP